MLLHICFLGARTPFRATVQMTRKRHAEVLCVCSVERRESMKEQG